MAIWKPLSELVLDVQNGSESATSLVQRSLDRISNKQSYNAIIATTKDRALERAKEIDQKIKNGENAGRLAGIPFIAKDNFLTFGSETTAASNMLKGFEAPYQATAINRLEAEGAICVAKANLDAFAHGSSTENSDVQVTKNPHDETRVPGGSSGGSAAAVVLEMAPFALGTDTGGSIRLPASYCGAVGYKPTYGRVSRSGVVAMASSTDVIGPLTMNVADAALVMACMAGDDELDSTTIKTTDDLSQLTPEIQNKTVGIIKEFMGDGVQSDVRDAILKSVNQLEAAGATIKEISLPALDLALACYYIIAPAEISSNLSRYDGQRYQHTSEDARGLEESYTKSRTEGFGREAKRRIMIGTYVLSSGYYDAYYKRAQLVRTKIIQEFNQAFQEVDFMMGPVAPTPAFKLGENTEDPMQMYLADVMTVGASLAGIPAISLPVAEVKGLPVGLQVMANQGCDGRLLSFSKAVEELCK